MRRKGVNRTNHFCLPLFNLSWISYKEYISNSSISNCLYWNQLPIRKSLKSAFGLDEESGPFRLLMTFVSMFTKCVCLRSRHAQLTSVPCLLSRCTTRFRTLFALFPSKPRVSRRKSYHSWDSLQLISCSGPGLPYAGVLRHTVRLRVSDNPGS